MFKIISIAVLGYIFYRMVIPKSIEPPKEDNSNNDTDDGEFIDYEEIDD